uniref:Uncharacterized protein n=1 Tax=Tanacetum cinerariifolium TaxID=118510 RepID=A0A6L2M4Z7_TANCI|nr:hypothetical protein [Tanacetum cinerariifolium]
MIAILEKYDHNTDFHKIIDFVEASHLSPSFSGRTVPLFESMLVAMGEGSGTPTEPHDIPSLEAQQTSPMATSSSSLPPITTKTLPTVIPTDTPQLRHYTRRARIAQSSALPPIADKPASPIGDDSEGEACPTDSGLEAEQDMANIAKTSTLPSDSTPRVTSLDADEGSMQQQLNELTALCISLQREDALIKGRSLDEGEAAAAKRSAKKDSDDSEEMVTVLTSLDAATILSSEVVEIPTGSGSIPTAGPPATGVPTGSDVVPTSSPIFTTATDSTPYIRRKGKENMVESDTPKKKKLQEQIDVQVARELEEEMARDAQRMNE